MPKSKQPQRHKIIARVLLSTSRIQYGGRPSAITTLVVFWIPVRLPAASMEEISLFHTKINVPHISADLGGFGRGPPLSLLI